MGVRLLNQDKQGEEIEERERSMGWGGGQGIAMLTGEVSGNAYGNGVHDVYGGRRCRRVNGL